MKWNLFSHAIKENWESEFSQTTKGAKESERNSLSLRSKFAEKPTEPQSFNHRLSLSFPHQSWSLSVSLIPSLFLSNQSITLFFFFSFLSPFHFSSRFPEPLLFVSFISFFYTSLSLLPPIGFFSADPHVLLSFSSLGFGVGAGWLSCADRSVVEMWVSNHLHFGFFSFCFCLCSRLWHGSFDCV